MSHDDFITYGDVASASILYASLDEQQARRRSVIKNVSGKVLFAFVRCVDGRGWTEEETEAGLSDKMRDRRRAEIAKGRDWLAKGAIACAMTHRSNLIGRIQDVGKFLCEDDAVLSPDVLDLIGSGELTLALDKLNGVTLLDYRSKSDIVAKGNPVATIGKYSVYRVDCKGVGSAACYFVPSHISKSIVEFQTPLHVPVDHWDEMIQGGAFSDLYVIHPRAARIGDFPTTINYAYAKKNKLATYLTKLKLLRRLKHMLMSYRGDFNEKITKWEV